MSYSIRLEETAESEYKSVTFKGTRVNNILGNKAAIPLLNSIFFKPCNYERLPMLLYKSYLSSKM